MEAYIAVITTIIAPTILFVLNRISARRDRTIDGLREEIKECRRANLRMQILQLIHHDPHNKDTILNLLDEYHALGGNSYITDVARRWLDDLNKQRKRKKCNS